jgi:hypothetical protein
VTDDLRSVMATMVNIGDGDVTGKLTSEMVTRLGEFVGFMTDEFKMVVVTWPSANIGDGYETGEVSWVMVM